MKRMPLQFIAGMAVILALSAPAFADSITDIDLRFSCGNRESAAVVAVGDLDAIKNSNDVRHVYDTKRDYKGLNLEALPRKKQRIICRSETYVISIIPLISDDHPRNNNVYILVNGVQVKRTFLIDGEYSVVTVVADPSGPFGVAVALCRAHINRPTSLDQSHPCAQLDRP